jgi:hypothetical protein
MNQKTSRIANHLTAIPLLLGGESVTYVLEHSGMRASYILPVHPWFKVGGQTEISRFNPQFFPQSSCAHES